MSGGPEVRQQLAEALDLHHPLLLTGHVSCSCGWRSETTFHIELTTARHREHVAHVLEMVVADHCERIAAERAAEALREAAAEFAAGGSACGDYWAPGTEGRCEAEDIARQISGAYIPHWPEAYAPYCDGCAAAEAADTDRDHVVSSLRARAEAMAAGRPETT